MSMLIHGQVRSKRRAFLDQAWGPGAGSERMQALSTEADASVRPLLEAHP
jgi:hypothetical protein